ncbi:MAG: BamA/TamA family outer membrane protein [Ignavibacteria bacterium]|nr:BamA/TamA family outer membrane protein [Ignavibacteria bacterium]MCC7159383.1 BamA/TamA family outer membrane protein [Ignavibacteria bacterium]
MVFFLYSAPVYSQGAKYETNDVDFVFKKTETFSDAALADILLLPKEKYFNRINLEEDLQRLNKFYFDNGFFDVMIDTSTSFIEEDKEVNVKFTIIENARYTVKEIKLTGLDKITDAAKTQVFQNKLINAGDSYVKNTISLEKDRIIGVLQDNGYYFAQIDTAISKIDSSRRGIIIGKYSDELQKNPEFKDKVLIRIRFIGTEDIYKFGSNSISIDKNKYNIGNNVIERELRFKTGDTYSKSKMLESERNFTKLAIIQLGRVLVDSVDINSKTIDTKVAITLNNKYEFTPSISAVYQSNRLFGNAGIEYKDKDFLGGGRVFSVSLEGLYNSINANAIVLSFSLFQPFLFNNDITATLTPQFALINFDENIEYVTSQNLLRLTYHIADYTFYSDAYSDLTFDYLTTRAKRDYVQDSIQYYKDQKSYSVNSILGLTLLHRNTNNLFNPSQGTFHTLTVESAGALPRLLSIFNKSLNYSQYVKLSTVNSIYQDISGGRAETILASHLEIGDIIEYGLGENVVPVAALYKFYMGGGNSLRGWRAQTGGILDDPSQGGNFLIEGSFELRRRPFPARSFLNPLWGVIFFDWGNVWETGGKFRTDQIALSTGIGIRYDTFVGPVRIDLGFKLYDPLGTVGNKWIWDKPSDIFKNKYAIQFGLGNAF